jgi:sugar phosphate isomerase/epimerase
MTTPIIIGSGLNLTSLKPGDLYAMDAMLARYVEIGCSHVELTARRLDIIAGGRIVRQRAEAITSILKRHDIKPVLHAHHGINMMDLPNQAMHRAVAEASIDLAGEMGFSSIVMHSGKAPSDVWLASKDYLLEREREEFKRLGDRAAKAGTQLAIENMIANPVGDIIAYGADPRPLADQLQEIGHPAIGGCLDFGHAYLSAPVMGFDYLDAIEAFSEQVWHLHLHDNFGIADHKLYVDAGDRVALGVGDLHMPMGWGGIPWADVLPRMRFRPGTYGMIELSGRYRAVEDRVAATARTFSDYWNGKADLVEALPTWEGA